MKVFIDANIILDKYDIERPFYQYSVKAYEYLIANAKLFTRYRVDNFRAIL